MKQKNPVKSLKIKLIKYQNILRKMKNYHLADLKPVLKKESSIDMMERRDHSKNPDLIIIRRKRFSKKGWVFIENLKRRKLIRN